MVVQLFFGVYEEAFMVVVKLALGGRAALAGREGERGDRWGKVIIRARAIGFSTLVLF